jgi:hypothetical protein
MFIVLAVHCIALLLLRRWHVFDLAVESTVMNVTQGFMHVAGPTLREGRVMHCRHDLHQDWAQFLGLFPRVSYRGNLSLLLNFMPQRLGSDERAINDRVMHTKLWAHHSILLCFS